MNSKVLIFFCLFAAAIINAKPVPEGEESEESSEESNESFESSEAKYSFNWAVNDESSENDFGHEESRDGDDTQGTYFVHLPDGRLQTVKYYVEGDSGYVAEVTYEGEAQYPESNESESESESEESDESDESE
ncbi:cuticle protein 19.8-like [Macrobrachium rosenbergii]|uniref:cuticle protein 19.8-like n=1 Tax=Macrobrachium rosenbergii TaxID=79674 RepID=UPI0034D47845